MCTHNSQNQFPEAETLKRLQFLGESRMSTPFVGIEASQYLDTVADHFSVIIRFMVMRYK